MALVSPENWTRNPMIVDLRDHEVFERGVPHEAFKVLRNEYPVYWNEEPDDDPGFWNLTKHADITAASLDTETFSSAQGINMYYDKRMDPGVVMAINQGSMITLDPPMHTAYRKIAQPFFTLQAVRKQEDRIREITNRILDRVAAKGACDFMEDVAAPLPIAILCDILGVPESDEHLIFEWSNKAIGLEDPDFNATFEEGVGNLLQIFAYGQQMAEDRRKCPAHDLMSAMVHAKPEGDDQEIPQYLMDGFFLLMVIAGNETTRNSISGGMHALIEHPDQRRKLLDNPELIPTAVDEILRWVSPVMHMRRTATRDTEIRGQAIKEGDKVVMWYIAANRDEDVFANPDTFDVTRDPNNHIAFGVGRHRCLGERLAKLQLRVMFTELLRRFPDMEITGPVTRMRTNFINGIKKMPVKFTPNRT